MYSSVNVKCKYNGLSRNHNHLSELRGLHCTHKQLTQLFGFLLHKCINVSQKYFSEAVGAIHHLRSVQHSFLFYLQD